MSMRMIGRKEGKESTRFLDAFCELLLQILYEVISLIRVQRHAGTAILQDLLDEDQDLLDEV